tara:strand:- start:17015 stop:23392 length:6378 start_codon:yes stop_codon:yes gene_type:complete
MPNKRFDNLPMNRAAQAGGDLNAVYLRQEVDPTSKVVTQRRTGTERQAHYGDSLGVVVDGAPYSAGWRTTQILTGSGAWTVQFSVKMGELFESSTPLPIFSLTEEGTGDSYVELQSKLGGKLSITSKQADGTAITDNGTTHVRGTKAHVAITYNGSNTLTVYVKDATSAAAFDYNFTLSDTIDAGHKYHFELGGNSKILTDKVSHFPHVISNLMVYSAALSTGTIGTNHGSRTPNSTSLVNHFKLVEGDLAVADDNGSTNVLLAHPAPASSVGGYIYFNGRSSAIKVQRTLDFEQFYTMPGRSVVSEAEYTIFLKGKVLGDPDVRTASGQVLADFGDLGKVWLNKSGYVNFTVDGTNMINDEATALADGSEFEIFAIKNTDGGFETYVNGAVDPSAGDVGPGFSPPNIDFGNPPHFWLGADNEELIPSGESWVDVDTRFSGYLEKFAFYKIDVTSDVGPTSDCLVYMDGGSFVDKTGKATGLEAVAKSSTEASCSYAGGAIEDAEHIAVAGGVVLAEGEAVGFTKGLQRLTKKFKSDADVLRIGSKLLVASNTQGHVLDEDSETVRQYGIPKPLKNVSCQQLAMGVLEGAASYGFRWVTADGTYGPMQRTDPAAITSPAGKFIIGSTEGAPLGGSELGETFMHCHKSTSESAQTGSDTSDIFGTPNDAKQIVMEVMAKVEEFDEDDVKPTIWNEGIIADNTPTHSYKSSMHTSALNGAINLEDPFSVQVAFKYKDVPFATGSSSNNSKGRMPGVGIFGINGHYEMGHIYSRGIVGKSTSTDASVPSICAWFVAGSSPELVPPDDWGNLEGEAGKWYTRYQVNNHVKSTAGYGNGGPSGAEGKRSPRLVLSLGREGKHFTQNYQESAHVSMVPISMQGDHKVLTFTDETELVYGSGSDESIWVHGHDYQLWVVRGDHDNSAADETSDSVRVYVNDATVGKWYELAGRTMNRLHPSVHADSGGSHGGSTSGTYNDKTFFTGWVDRHPTDRQVYVGACGGNAILAPFMMTNGQQSEQMKHGHDYLGGADPRVVEDHQDLIQESYSNSWGDDAIRVFNNFHMGGMLHSAAIFAFRLFSRALNLSEIQAHGQYRYAAQPGAELHYPGLATGHVVLDNLCTLRDPSVPQTSWPDGAGGGGVVWNYRYQGFHHSGNRLAKQFVQDVDYANLKKQPLLMLGLNGTALSAQGTVVFSGYVADGDQITFKDSSGVTRLYTIHSTPASPSLPEVWIERDPDMNTCGALIATTLTNDTEIALTASYDTGSSTLLVTHLVTPVSATGTIEFSADLTNGDQITFKDSRSTVRVYEMSADGTGSDTSVVYINNGTPAIDTVAALIETTLDADAGIGLTAGYVPGTNTLTITHTATGAKGNVTGGIADTVDGGSVMTVVDLNGGLDGGGKAGNVTDGIVETTDSTGKMTVVDLHGGMDVVTPETSPLCLYYCTRGEGSIVLQTMGEDMYGLTTEPWSAGSQTGRNFELLSSHEFINDFHMFNMFTIGLTMTGSSPSGKFGTAGESYGLQVTGMAVNGNVIFDSPLKEDVALPVYDWSRMDDKNWITLGGYADSSNNETDTFTGEFRIWGNNKGPEIPDGDPGPNGWNVNDRLIESEYEDCHAYYRFTRQDVEGTYNPTAATTTIRNIGLYSPTFDNLVMDQGALITDARMVEDGSTAVGFPRPPRPDLVALELFRTITQGIVDVDVEKDVQIAMDNVRYAPLYFVARIPSGSNHYVDGAPNSALGFGAPYTDYQVPEDVKQFFTWQGQLGVVGSENKVYYTEPGAFGWETFPHQLVYEVRIAGGGASPLNSGRSTGDTLYLFGRDWCAAVVGSPGNETEFPLEGGVGSYGPKTSINIQGIVYAFNGRLWAIDRVGQVDFKVAELSLPFNDLLPTHENVRMAISNNLASLYIIDENTGDAVRLFLSTGEASVEKRDAIAVGDNSVGEDVWCHLSGSYAKGNSAVYGDDVQTDTPGSNTKTISGAVFTTDGNLSTKVHLGLRVGIVDSAGAVQDTTITAFNSTTITVAAHDAIADGAATMYFGASSDGMLIDSGYIDTENENSMAAISNINLNTGTGVEVGLSGSPTVGVRAISDAQFVTVTTADIEIGGNLRGRFLRCILRNRTPEATSLSHLDLEITSPYK